MLSADSSTHGGTIGPVFSVIIAEMLIQNDSEHTDVFAEAGSNTALFHLSSGTCVRKSTTGPPKLLQ